MNKSDVYISLMIMPMAVFLTILTKSIEALAFLISIYWSYNLIKIQLNKIKEANFIKIFSNAEKKAVKFFPRETKLRVEQIPQKNIINLEFVKDKIFGGEEEEKKINEWVEKMKEAIK